MNVLKKLTIVILKPRVLIQREVTHVAAIQDLLEMDLSVKVI